MSEDPSALVDVHNHLVPGVDDGVATLEEALEGVGRFTREGVRRIAVTPHLRGSLTREPEEFEVRMAEVEEGWSELASAVEREYPEVALFRGHEVMLDVPDPDLSDPRLRIGGASFVLVEWPRLQIPPATGPVLARIRSAGYRPVIAHPERYHGMDPEWNLPGEWRAAGAYLQVNHGSLLGRYGPRARDRALAFLERGWVHYLASDFHGHAGMDPFVTAVGEFLAGLGAEEHFHLLVRSNPHRLLEDLDPIPLPPLRIRRSLWERLRAILRAAERERS